MNDFTKKQIVAIIKKRQPTYRSILIDTKSEKAFVTIEGNPEPIAQDISGFEWAKMLTQFNGQFVRINLVDETISIE